MSGILNRMAKRALGTLPAVEPRSAPRFAPSTFGSATAETSVADMQEVFAEPGNSRNDPVSSQQKNPRLPTEQSEWQSAPRETFELQRMRETSQQTTPRSPNVNDALPEREVGRRNSRNLDAHRKTKSPQSVETDNTSVEVQKSVSKNGSSLEETWTLEALMPSAQKQTVQSEFVPTEGNNAIAAEKSHTPGGSVALPSHFERIVEKDSVNEALVAPPASRSGAMHRQKSEQRTEAAKDVSAPMLESSSEPKTEIHISIGSIELRAPRTEVRPQAAPFRPRVTLEEFLRRKPETRR